MPHLVVGDAPRQVAQHRFVAGLFQRAVVGGGAGFHHAAGRHFQALGRLELVDRAGLAVLVEEACIAALPVEFRPDMLDIAPQRQPVLQFLGFPVLGKPVGRVGHTGVIGGKVACIGVGSALDERGRHQQVEEIAVAAYAFHVDRLVVDVADRPRPGGR
ncbi:hypothetical protein D3C72_1817180 [compost metagenome]